MSKNLTGNTEASSPGKVILLIRILFFAVFFLSVAGLIYFSSIDPTVSIEYKEPVFIDDWTVTAPDSHVFHAGSTFRNDGKRIGVFTMEATLPEISSDNSWFCFIVGGDVSIYINGELRKDFIEARDIVIPGGCVKRFYLRVPVTRADSGAAVKIVRHCATRTGFVYQNTLVADSTGFFAFMMSRYGLATLLEIVLLIFSAVIVIISLIMRLMYKRRIELLYGAMSILVIAGWLITNSFLFPFLTGHYHIDGVMNYMLCLMMPFCLAFYLDALQHGRYRTIVQIALCISSLNLIIWPILHFTGTFAFPDALLIIDAVLGIDLLLVAGILIVDFIRGGMKEYKYTAIGLSGFMICGFGEILVLNFIPVINGDILMLTGLAFMLALTVVQQMVDLRKVREEVKRAVDLSEAKTKFLASMSHEIRTPINAILGMNEMILRENRDPVIGEYAASVKSSGQMLLMLVNDVLDFSRIEAGKMEINEAPFTFSSLLLGIMPMLKERADEKNLLLDVILLNEVPDGMISDEFRIRQILINLINNAIKYTDKGSVLLMIGGDHLDNDTYMVRLSVKDTGRGISDEGQKNLFDAFSRADEKKNRNIEGTGLGLAIVKSIVDSMGGNISVVSRLGEGSEFIVYLPVKISDRTPLSKNYERYAPKSDADEKTGEYLAPEASVLAVDDNSSNLKIVKLFLKHVGIVPELCDSGLKAIELCRSKHYDLLLLDHMMPDPDGIKTLSIIRNDAASLNRDTPAVVLTANAVAGSDKIYADAGFVDYLTKPLDSDLLEQTVKKYLPSGKILPADASAVGDVHSTAAMRDSGETQKRPSFKEKLERIDGLDYQAALKYAGGDEELLKEVVAIIAEESGEKIEKMRRDVALQDWDEYRMTAHAIKGLMASVGLRELSGQARMHEEAAKNRDTEYILSECEGFFKTYLDVCNAMK